MTQAAEPAECLLEWQCSHSFGGPRLRCYLGAAHGIAGILHTLLQLPAELALVMDSVRLSKTIKTCQGCQLCWGLLSSSIIHCYPLQSGFQWEPTSLHCHAVHAGKDGTRMNEQVGSCNFSLKPSQTNFGSLSCSASSAGRIWRCKSGSYHCREADGLGNKGVLAVSVIASSANLALPSKLWIFYFSNKFNLELKFEGMGNKNKNISGTRERQITKASLC